jgi:peptidyl-prolyl cis-trans isomerase B (cyclophilin B)
MITMGLLSARQLVTIRDFGTQPMRIHVGPAGCGKTLTTSIGLGKYLQHRPVDGRGYAILGRTQQTAKRNVCNYLTKYFGDDFKYTNSKKDGTDKDALLFGHPIYLAGLNDKSSIDKIWGASLAGILGDEMTKWKEEQLLLLMSRIRGEKIPGQDLWFEGATNPDHPKHWLKKYIDNKDNGVDLIQWTEYDVIYDGAIEYYTGLRKRYKDYPSLLNRYVYGLWTAADNLIYLGFSEAYHVIPLSDLQHVKTNTVKNFISLISKGYYNGLIFHRVIPGFMIQGGDPQGTGMGGPGYSIKGEFKANGFNNPLMHDKGVLSMARAANPDSAGSQFFIMVEKAPHLDGQYAAFGKVIEGMEEADRIVGVKRDYNDRPREEQRMKTVTVETFGETYEEPAKK